MERPFALGEILSTSEGQKSLKRYLSGVDSRRNPTGAAIALDIQRNFKLPGDEDTKPENKEE